MYMKYFINLSLIITLIFTSCQNKSEPTLSPNVSGKILNHKEKVLTLYDFLGKSQWEQQIDVNDSIFHIKLEIEKPVITTLGYGNNQKDIFIVPNKSLIINFDANRFEASFQYNGELAIVNSILDTISSNLRNMDFNVVYSQPLNVAVKYLDSIEENSKNKLQMLTKNSSTTDRFNDYTTKFIEYQLAMLKLIIAERQNEVPENYYNFLNKLSYSDPNLLDISYYRAFLSSYIDKETNSKIEKLDSTQRQNFDIQFKESLNVIQQFENEEIRAYLLYNKMMTELLNSGINDFEKYYDYFKRNNKDPHYKEQLQIAYKEKMNIAPGQKAPKFTLNDINGNKVSLSDFKGKYIYLDFWATTCPYCRKESPSYLKLYSDYGSNEIEFISISADLKEDRWKNYVKENKNVGTILRVENSWDSDAFQAYQINSSPTYVIIDKEGNILDPVAPRPSSKEIRETFDKLLNN